MLMWPPCHPQLQMCGQTCSHPTRCKCPSAHPCMKFHVIRRAAFSTCTLLYSCFSKVVADQAHMQAVACDAHLPPTAPNPLIIGAARLHPAVRHGRDARAMHRRRIFRCSRRPHNQNPWVCYTAACAACGTHASAQPCRPNGRSRPAGCAPQVLHRLMPTTSSSKAAEPATLAYHARYGMLPVSRRSLEMTIPPPMWSNQQLQQQHQLTNK